MSERDFRYEMPDGKIVEAFQMTEATRFQEKNWPDWMNSRMLMTKESTDGASKTNWLTIDDVETEIPSYGWLVNDAGRIHAVEYEVMEQARKIVPEEVVIPDKASYMPDDALRLAAKLSGRPFEDVKRDDRAQVDTANRKRQEMIDDLARAREAEIMGPDLEQVSEVVEVEVPVAVATATSDRGLLFEVRGAYQLLLEQNDEEAMTKLHDALLERCNWCSCPPGKCDGAADMWDCRRNSPLAK
jgi:hypothetical protein